MVLTFGSNNTISALSRTIFVSDHALREAAAATLEKDHPYFGLASTEVTVLGLGLGVAYHPKLRLALID
ncbi:hypothetical protein H1R20_g12603, partial [Candolleomyces eurysporus]